MMWGHELKTVWLKKGIILFWAIWWMVTFWTDLIGMFSHMSLIQKSWAPDINYPFLVESLKMYQVSPLFAQLCFAGIMAWSLLSAWAFIRTCCVFNKETACWMKRADTAFIISLCFWLALFLADQLIMKFDLEENHMVQGGFELLTYLSLYILPHHSERP
ncbi:hypothetical protein [Legionella worsleiensis]|uniref:Transmembrane protein n=1 Tax=Legionella worsleiensis TaxID=45076 RepID=A0A0W1ALU5_9GAMM|nr:hypothetical protein [Legionella worsleiensis]KTD82131.1 hypothetical protein Lwor_0051 [Legionella worsleiensis]STY31406.1 Uncharacterised protein [Legionella worsleiensis]